MFSRQGSWGQYIGSLFRKGHGDRYIGSLFRVDEPVPDDSSKFYSLDAIIAVGYRVSSIKATRFRQWSTKILNEYIKKGFVMDDERLKQGKAVFGKDYFRELLERVRSIRASERPSAVIS